jgi:hypothetical protein
LFLQNVGVVASRRWLPKIVRELDSVLSSLKGGISRESEGLYTLGCAGDTLCCTDEVEKVLPSSALLQEALKSSGGWRVSLNRRTSRKPTLCVTSGSG